MGTFTIIGLFLAGLLLLLLELVVPSMGLLSVLSLTAFVASFILAYQQWGAPGLAVFVVAALMTVPFLFRLGMKRLTLHQALDREQGYSGVTEKQELVGQRGIAFTPLRPSGTVAIGEDRIDAVAEGVMIEKSTPVEIVRVEGNRVIVAPCPTGGTTA